MLGGLQNAEETTGTWVTRDRDSMRDAGDRLQWIGQMTSHVQTRASRPFKTALSSYSENRDKVIVSSSSMRIYENFKFWKTTESTQNAWTLNFGDHRVFVGKNSLKMTYEKSRFGEQNILVSLRDATTFYFNICTISVLCFPVTNSALHDWGQTLVISLSYIKCLQLLIGTPSSLARPVHHTNQSKHCLKGQF